MNIDFVKLFNLLLVTSLRSGLTDIVKSCAYAFNYVYASFKAMYAEAVLYAAITCQVMYLELIINYVIFGDYKRTIYITDGDQITVDFVVNVPASSNYNVQLLVALLEKYKPTGKRYTINQSQLVYNVTWSDFVCEKISRTFIANWSDFVCELEQTQTMQYNHLNVYYMGSELYVVPDYPTVSVIRVDLLVNGTTVNVVIPIESTGYEAFGTEITSVSFVEINPTEDANFWYRSGDISHSTPPSPNQ